MEKIIGKFNVDGKVLSCERHGAGHINETYKFSVDNGEKKGKLYSSMRKYFVI